MTPLARRLHALAARAYPAAFRAQFGADLDRVFVARLSRAAARSRALAAIWLVFLLLDTVASGFAERARAPRRPALGLDALAADLRLAVRQFRRAPGFAALVVLSLALGIGASTAIFSVVHAVLLRPLPYADPDRLVAIWSDNTTQGQINNPVSPANYEAFKTAPALARTEAMFSFLTANAVQIDGAGDYVQIATITPGMFDLLGRRPVVGTVFQPGDTALRVVLSYGYWQRRFGGDHDVVGRRVLFPGTPPVTATVAGVMPADFTFPYRSMLGPSGFTQAIAPDMWYPLLTGPNQGGGQYLDAAGQPIRTIHYLAVIGRLAPGATLDRARADLSTVADRRALAFPDTNHGWAVTVRPLHDQTVGAMETPLLLLLGGVAVVLLITCVNVANVLLARAGARRQDLAVRSALGASAGRLTQHALVESLTLGVTGGAAGLGLAFVGIRALVAGAPATVPRIGETSMDVATMLFAVAVSLAAGALVGVMPAAAAAHAPASDALRESRRTTSSAARRRARGALVVAEVSLAMALAVGAGLLLRSFVAVLDVDPGFRSDGLLTMQLNVPPRTQQDSPARLAFYDALEARLRAVPGVVDVGGTTRLPLGSTSVSTTLNVEGRAVAANQMPDVELRRAVFDYFGTMGIPIERGRSFSATDGPTSPVVGVVNSALVAKVFPGEDPIGRRVRLGPNPTATPITIVGVIGSVRHRNLEETPRPELYLYYRQNSPQQPFVVLRTATDPSSLAPAARQAVREAGADAPFDVKTMAEVRDASVAERRFVLALVGLFGAIALALAAMGVYGVIALVASERAPEVGIRLALGARPREVLGLIVAQAARLAGAGIVAGGLLAVFVAPLLSSQLFGVTSFDPLTYAGVAAALFVAAIVAAYAPARRAMRTDPAVTLRT